MAQKPSVLAQLDRLQQEYRHDADLSAQDVALATPDDVQLVLDRFTEALVPMAPDLLKVARLGICPICRSRARVTYNSLTGHRRCASPFHNALEVLEGRP